MTEPSASPRPTLLRSRRFLPLFLTQFLGAFNDNVFKNALVILITFQAAREHDISLGILLNLAAGLFILPFFLFSALAGQWADKYEKSGLVRKIKQAEIGIMLLGALALWLNHLEAQLLVLFLMGTQSAFFGPLKYALIPQHVSPDELVGGNAWVELGTFSAILLGTIIGGVLGAQPQATLWVSAAVIGFALLGYASSTFIPHAPASQPDLKLDYRPFRHTRRTLSHTRKTPLVFSAIFAISWFWFLGASYLTQVPALTQQILQGTPASVSGLLAAFSVGIGIGSLACEFLTKRGMGLRLVIIGSLGISVFGLDLYFALQHEALSPTHVGLLLSQWSHQRIALDLIAIGISGGLYIVPLYALIQQRVPSAECAQAIAATNVVNAVFMVASAVVGALLLGVLELSLSHFFGLLAVANALQLVILLRQAPAFWQHA